MEQQVTQGLVFWFGTNIKQEFGQSNSNAEYIIQGRRPHIVISDNSVNNRGKICTLVPCTTNIGIENPYHVKVQVFPDKISMALCDQMLSVNQSELLKNELICNLDSTNIDRILHGCSKALGLDTTLNSDAIKASLSDLESKIYQITDSVISQQTNNFAQSFVANITNNITNQITSKFSGMQAANTDASISNKSVSEPISTSDVLPVSAADVDSCVSINSDGTYNLPRHNTTGRVIWSDTLYTRFLNDYRTLSIEEMMHRWNYTRQQVHEAKFRAVHRYDKYAKTKSRRSS